MKARIVLLLGVLLVYSTALMAQCPDPVLLGQIWRSHYAGLDVQKAEGFYLIQDRPESRTLLATAESFYAWDNGAFMWTEWGEEDSGSGFCPLPADLPGRTLVLAVSSPGAEGGRFLLDSTVWDAGLQVFNMDKESVGAVEAGSIPSPIVRRVELQTDGTWRLEIRLDLPASGVYPVKGSTPRALLAGILLVGASTNEDPRTAAWEPLAFVEIPSLYPESVSCILRLTSLDDVRYLAATLIMEDGSGSSLDQKPVLAHVGKPVALNPRWVRPSAGKPPQADEQGALEGTSLLLTGIQALGEKQEVQVTWLLEGESAEETFLISGSYDHESWIPLALLEGWQAAQVTGQTRLYEWSHFLGERSSTAGLYYRVDLMDAQGQSVQTLWTRARMKDWR